VTGFRFHKSITGKGKKEKGEKSSERKRNGGLAPEPPLRLGETLLQKKKEI